MFKSITFEVIGERRLNCEGCEQRIAALLKTTEGVQQARAAAQEQRIEVLFDAGVVDSAVLAERISTFGYRTRVINTDSASPADSGDERPMGAPQVDRCGCGDNQLLGDSLLNATSGGGAVAGRLSNGGKSRTHQDGTISVGRMLAGLPGALLVPGLCPACWPAYIGILSAFGLGFILKSWVFLPLFVAALLIALASLAWKARGRHGYWPLILGVAASAILLAGQFALNSDPLRYVGAVVLFAACVWNGWPRPSGAACPNCPPAGNPRNEAVKSNGENK